MMRFLKSVHERRVGVALPHQQAQRFLFLTAADAGDHEYKDSEEEQATFHFSPLRTPPSSTDTLAYAEHRSVCVRVKTRRRARTEQTPTKKSAAC